LYLGFGSNKNKKWIQYCRFEKCRRLALFEVGLHFISFFFFRNLINMPRWGGHWKKSARDDKTDQTMRHFSLESLGFGSAARDQIFRNIDWGFVESQCAASLSNRMTIALSGWRETALVTGGEKGDRNALNALNKADIALHKSLQLFTFWLFSSS
jgi:hypothetical protein